jgi:hypothetical protein
VPLTPAGSPPRSLEGPDGHETAPEGGEPALLLARRGIGAATEEPHLAPLEWAAGQKDAPPRHPRWRGQAKLGPPPLLPTVYSTASPSLRLW